MTDIAKKPIDPARLLGEADLLLREGLKRIASAQSDLPDAQTPLEEALRLTEEQTMATIAAVERAQESVQEIRQANGTFIDEPLDRIDSALGTILASQQGQDLAGQRLKKSIALLHAVEDRIRLALEELGLDGVEAARASCTDSEAKQSINQDDVDALLAELGI
jgi:chemotaxis protein CheZ